MAAFGLKVPPPGDTFSVEAFQTVVTVKPDLNLVER